MNNKANLFALDVNMLMCWNKNVAAGNIGESILIKKFTFVLILNKLPTSVHQHMTK